MGEKMKKTILSIAVFLFIFFSVVGAGDTTMDKKEMFSLEGLGNIYLSQEAKELLRQNGFVVTPGDKDEIYDVYAIAWIDKELQTTLSSWTELRHDTILYAKQSQTMLATVMPQKPEFTHGYVEPYPEVYQRIEEMMKDLRCNLEILGITPEGVSEKIRSFENLLAKLKTISEKELIQKSLTEEEYKLIWNIGDNLASMKNFPSEIMKKITSDTDEKIDLVADVHTDPNTKQVLEEGVGSPFDIWVIIEDSKGKRLCRGVVFSYYEFKHPVKDRLTDEKWQEMEEKKERPLQPDWLGSFIVN